MTRRRLGIGSVSGLILLVITFWIIWFLYCYAWVHSIHIVADVLNIVLVLGMLMIIVSGVINIFQFVWSRNNTTSSGKKIGLLFILTAIITIHLYMYFSLLDSGYATAGSTYITNKLEKDHSYYFYVKSFEGRPDIEIECTENIYDELIVDKAVLYTMDYRWITYNNKGVLNNINTSDFIDNRR